MLIARLGCLLLGCLVLVACSLNKVSVEPTPLRNAQREIPEQELLDIGILVFDPGQVDGEDTDEKGGGGQEIRKAEARFFPNHLKHTLQQTAQWGAVRVLPAESKAMDVLVRGVIKESTGTHLLVAISATDARGEEWFERSYEAEAEAQAYSGTRVGEQDVFQDLYNTIANDLVAARARFGPAEQREIRDLAAMKFASDLAPDAFGDYLQQDGDGHYTLERLPAENDLMMRRLLGIREREYMLIDTLNEYYDQYYRQMWDSYQDWRKARREEALALARLEASARNRFLLGAGAILGAIAVEILSDGRNTSTLRNVMVMGGAVAVKSGFDKHADSKIHSDAIRELDHSFDAEVAPMVMDVEGRTVKLTGSAEQQYQNWRQVLKEIYRAETGFAGASLEMPQAGGDNPDHE